MNGDALTNPLLPDELDKVKPGDGHDLISATATYLNQRQIERHQALLGRVGNRLEQLEAMAKGKK